MKYEDFDYCLPKELIAKRPAEPRDSARLFVFDTKTGEIKFNVFRNLANYLPKNSLLVLNDTKVIPARVVLFKESGGKVEVLFLLNDWRGAAQIGSARRGVVQVGSERDAYLMKVLADRKIVIGQKLYFSKVAGPGFEIVGQEENIFSLKPLFESDKIFDLLNQYGKMPIPKYIKGTNLSELELRKSYQTIFADKPSSVAAPTASLHFSEQVFKDLKLLGIEKVFVTLNVGLGTFAPISEKNVSEDKLHRELYDISYKTAKVIKEAKNEKRAVIAVGTTVVRTLESVASQIAFGDLRRGLSGETEIFIHPPFNFKIVDKMITNFHLPNSSLMMLVEAFLRHKKSPKTLIELYKIAIAEKFRFYSFGDAMLIL